jgi:hypothetical protein
MEGNVPDVSKGSLMIPPNWGPDAVVCDPWYHEWFAVEALTDWQTKMKRILIDASTKKPAAKAVEKSAAIAEHNEQEFAKIMLRTNTFDRVAYLPHGDPGLMKLACSNIQIGAHATRYFERA